MHSTMANLLLTKLNTGNRFFDARELPDFDDITFDADDEIAALEKAGLIRKVGARKYKIVVDIYTLRQSVLAGEKSGVQDEPPEAGGLCRADITDSVWRVKRFGKKLPSRSRKGGEDDEYSRRREYLERRRRELIARLREDEKNASGGDDDDEDETSADGEGETSEEEIRRNLAELFDNHSEEAGLAIAALKMCADGDYISAELLEYRLNISSDAASGVCLFLYFNDFITGEDGKFRLAFPKELLGEYIGEAEKRREAVDRLAGVLAEVAKREARRGTNTVGYNNAVRQKVADIFGRDAKMTRGKAITMAEGCLYAARDLADKAAITLYEGVLSELKNMSDYIFNRLKISIKS